MKPKSRIQKGRDFENYCAREIEAEGLGAARREIGSGCGKKKGDIFANLPFLLECKNEKNSQKLFTNIKQAKEQARIGNWNADKWALIIREPRSPTENPNAYAVIDYHEFLKLLKKESEPLVKEPDRNLRFKLERLKQSAQEVIKEL